MCRTTAALTKSCTSSLRLWVFSGLLLIFASASMGADAPRNSLGVSLSFGDADPEGPAGQLAATYWYDITPSLSLGAAYKDGGTITDDDLVYTAVTVSAEGRILLSERFRRSLYGRLSGVSYDYDDRGDEFKDHGYSHALATGFSMRFGTGVGFEVGYEYLRLGSDKHVSSVGLGITYSF